MHGETGHQIGQTPKHEREPRQQSSENEEKPLLRGGDGIIRAGGQRCSLAKVQLGNPGHTDVLTFQLLSIRFQRPADHAQGGKDGRHVADTGQHRARRTPVTARAESSDPYRSDRTHRRNRCRLLADWDRLHYSSRGRPPCSVGCGLLAAWDRLHF